MAFGWLGKALKKAAPYAGFIIGNAIAPGVGGAVGAGIGGAISKTGKGKNVGDVLLGGAEGAAGGALANTISPGKGASIGGLVKGLGGNGGTGGGSGVGGAVVNGLKGLVTNPDGSLNLGKILKTAGTVGALGLGAADVKENADARKAAEAAMADRQALLQRNLSLAETEYGNKASFRTGGMSALSNYFNSGGRGIFNAPVTAGDTSGKNLQPSPWGGAQGPAGPNFQQPIMNPVTEPRPSTPGGGVGNLANIFHGGAPQLQPAGPPTAPAPTSLSNIGQAMQANGGSPSGAVMDMLRRRQQLAPAA